VYRDKPPRNEANSESPIVELRPMPDIIPTPGVGNFASKKEQEA
jgi:hypothetical protein